MKIKVWKKDGTKLEQDITYLEFRTNNVNNWLEIDNDTKVEDVATIKVSRKEAYKVFSEDPWTGSKDYISCGACSYPVFKMDNYCRHCGAQFKYKLYK